MAHGFVYFLENPSMRGLFKVGFTRNHPIERAKQLSASTSCPTPFRILAYFGHEDAAWAEKAIHENLAEYRVNGNREFFKTSYFRLQHMVEAYSDSLVDAVYDGYLKACVAQEEIMINAAMEALA